MNFDDVSRIGLQLPETSIGTSYGTPSLNVRKKSFCRMWSDGEKERKGPVDHDVLVTFTTMEAKAAWIESSNGMLFDQEHYFGWPTLLVHLDRVDEDTLADVLEESWRVKATAAMVKTFDAGG